MKRNTTISRLGEGSAFAYNGELYSKVDPEYTPSGTANAKNQITDEYLTLDPDTKVEYVKTSHFRYF